MVRKKFHRAPPEEHQEHGANSRVVGNALSTLLLPTPANNNKKNNKNNYNDCNNIHNIQCNSHESTEAIPSPQRLVEDAAL